MVKVTSELKSKYIDSSRWKALSDLLERAKQENETLDISDAHFVPKCANLLTAAYCSGLKIVGGPKLMMELLEENLRRSKVSVNDYPNVIKLPDESFKDAVDYINNMSADLKWRVDPDKRGDIYYITFVALIVLIRNDLEIYIDPLAYAVIDLIHKLFINIDGKGKYYCISNGDVRVVTREADTGLYDVGEYGKITEEQFRIRFKAVPYAFGNEEYPSEWEKPVLKPLLNRLHNKYSSNKGKSLYAFIGGKE